MSLDPPITLLSTSPPLPTTPPALASAGLVPVCFFRFLPPIYAFLLSSYPALCAIPRSAHVTQLSVDGSSALIEPKRFQRARRGPFVVEVARASIRVPWPMTPPHFRGALDAASTKDRHPEKPDWQWDYRQIRDELHSRHYVMCNDRCWSCCGRCWGCRDRPSRLGPKADVPRACRCRRRRRPCCCCCCCWWSDCCHYALDCWAIADCWCYCLN
mmetsp:Transcript_24099/g.43074  ORF Transcript_24099/g.43074 Transcript_24099/m.43074 type:complete len:214 (-) Transcript_24099:1491-2132(-)